MLVALTRSANGNRKTGGAYFAEEIDVSGFLGKRGLQVSQQIRDRPDGLLNVNHSLFLPDGKLLFGVLGAYDPRHTLPQGFRRYHVVRARKHGLNGGDSAVKLRVGRKGKLNEGNGLEDFLIASND